MIRKGCLGFAASLLFTSLLFALPFSAYAADWKMSDGGWQYFQNGSTPVTDTWEQSDGKWFYIGNNGFMETSSLISENDNLYYVDSDGAMVRNQWIQIPDEDDQESSWYYFSETGKACRNNSGKMSTKKINGKKYLFNSDGRMLTGLVDSEGEQVSEDSSNDFINAMYYFGEDGAMYENRWYLYPGVHESGTVSSLAQKDYYETGEMWMYFDANGKKVYAKDLTSPKKKTINGKNFMFDENGILIYGVAEKNATIPATYSNASFQYGKLDSDGSLPSNTWAWVVPNEGVSEDDYNDQEYSWFRTNDSGKVYRNCLHTVNGRRYAFDGTGRMQTGFVIMYTDGTFAIQYNVDVWNREDFLKDADSSDIPSIERGNLYLFSSDEVNDGSMVTGKNISVELQDGTAVFGFRSNGKAYGNRCTLEKSGKSYYYNGLRLDADSDLKYGIVDVDGTVGTSGQYVVVDSQGNLKKFRKKVLKDGDGYWIVIQDGHFVARIGDGDAPRWHEGQYWRYDSSLKGEDRFIEPITFASFGDDNLDDDFVVFQQ